MKRLFGLLSSTDWDNGYLKFFLVISNFIGCLAVISQVAYTEIDWKAYMQEVEGVINGELNYTNLRGDTGPLVYPAGFVWIFSGLYYITNNGENILLAQVIYAFLYSIMIAIVVEIYARVSKQVNIPVWVGLLLIASRRIQSIFTLRLFNDCWAMLFLYLSIYLFIKKKWALGSLIISVALSIKMNILLFFPPMLVVFVKELGFIRSTLNLIIIALFQIVVGLPFILTYPAQYFHLAFDFSRQFFYIWTVNWKIVSEELFLSKEFATTLLALHLGLLVIFGFIWTSSEGGVFATLLGKHHVTQKPYSISAAHLVALFFTGNFLGIFCSRSLHYQFYVWYYHTLPFLLWCTPYPSVFRVAILVAIEVVWNVYPSRAWSSGLLVACHCLILLGLFIGKLPSAVANSKQAQIIKAQNKKTK